MDRHRLTEIVMHDRLRDHVHFLYQNYAFFIKGAVVVVAGAAIYFILTAPNVPHEAERVAFWMV